MCGSTTAQVGRSEDNLVESGFSRTFIRVTGGSNESSQAIERAHLLSRVAGF